VVGRPPAPQRAFEDEGELLADPGLADELVQPLRPERTLDHPVIGISQRGDQPVTLGGGQLRRLAGRRVSRRVGAVGRRWIQGRSRAAQLLQRGPQCPRHVHLPAVRRGG